MQSESPNEEYSLGWTDWCMHLNWYIDSVEEWAYIHPDLVRPDLVPARCKTRQDKTRQDKRAAHLEQEWGLLRGQGPERALRGRDKKVEIVCGRLSCSAPRTAALLILLAHDAIKSPCGTPCDTLRLATFVLGRCACCSCRLCPTNHACTVGD